MVRVKIVCKDVLKILKKRLFEMKQSLYLIQFKVEGKAGMDGDDNDSRNGDDNDFEEADQDLNQDYENLARQKGGGGVILAYWFLFYTSWKQESR
jgi:hypothetical protein